jgi:hypothetical protein
MKKELFFILFFSLSLLTLSFWCFYNWQIMGVEIEGRKELGLWLFVVSVVVSIVGLGTWWSNRK